MKAIILFSLVLCSVNANADEVVRMKNGDVYRGQIVEQRFNQYIQVRFRDGNEKRLKWEEIEGTEKDGAQRAVAMEPQAAHAEDKPASQESPAQEPNGYARILAGNASILSTGGGNFLNYAAAIGTSLGQTPSGQYAVGLYISSYAGTSASSGITLDPRVTAIMLDIGSRKAFGTGLYMGGRFGAGITSLGLSSSTTSTSASGTSFAVGPVLGYEIDASKQVSIDLDAMWFARSGVTLTYPSGTSLTFDSVSALILQAGIGLHF